MAKVSWCGLLLLFMANSAVANDPVPVRSIDFADIESGTVQEWLTENGFSLEQDAGNDRLVGLDADPRGLRITAKRPAFALMTTESANVEHFSTVALEWGVDNPPSGSAYDPGILNEQLIGT